MSNLWSTSSKYYYICIHHKYRDRIEVVHPRQLRDSDKVLFEANCDYWNEFQSILIEHHMNPHSLHYEKVVSLWDRYLTWMVHGYPEKPRAN